MCIIRWLQKGGMRSGNLKPRFKRSVGLRKSDFQRKFDLLTVWLIQIMGWACLGVKSFLHLEVTIQQMPFKWGWNTASDLLVIYLTIQYDGMMFVWKAQVHYKLLRWNSSAIFSYLPPSFFARQVKPQPTSHPQNSVLPLVRYSFQKDIEVSELF